MASPTRPANTRHGAGSKPHENAAEKKQHAFQRGYVLEGD
jgi:hypothetical protein